MPAAPGRTGAWKCCTLSSMGRWTRTPVGSARRRVPWVRCGGWPIASSPTCAARCRSDGLPSACAPIRRGCWRSAQPADSQRINLKCHAPALSSPTCGKRGIDGGKKVKGIKINILVDKHGFPLAVAISTANVHDCVGIIPALKEVSTSGFRGKVLGDTSYQGENLKTTGQDLGIEVETKVCGAKGKF